LPKEFLTIKGARANNLKNVDVTVPRDKLIVFTGLSGSGKSSLAFDTIYAEGYRRFVESLSSYARQFLGQLDKPDVDLIDGLSPAISIDQKTTSKNPRSTVGTVTEIYDYLRLLYARIGVPHCHVCGKEISAQSIDQISQTVKRIPEGTRFQILSPVVRAKKGMHEKVISDVIASGFTRAKIDGFTFDLSEVEPLDKNKKHNIEIIVDRLVMNDSIDSRLIQSLETALELSGGYVTIERFDKEESDPKRYITLSQNYACDEHNVSVGELSPGMFSFNNPYGACDACNGLGMKRVISKEKIAPDLSLSLKGGAIQCNGFKSLDKEGFTTSLVRQVGERHGFTLDMPLSQFSEKALDVLFYGVENETYPVTFAAAGTIRTYNTKFEGIINSISRRYAQSNDEYYEQFLDEIECPVCNGKRLNKEILAVTVNGVNISDLCNMSVHDLIKFFSELRLNEMQSFIAKEILKEINARLSFLQRVGLEYLTLSRRAGTLSGGESQRIRLATQIGSSLTGVLYILDEPSIGLHQRDNTKLIKTLKTLKDAGNTVIVVEHDTETIENADYIVDIGPKAGVHGGEVVAAGTVSEVMNSPRSYTGKFLSGELKIDIPKSRNKGNGKLITIKGARENNLKNIDVNIPLGTFTCVTGVSGSGKSSLINSILLKEISRKLNKAYTTAGKCDGIYGYEELDKIIAIDQSPIGRTPRSNPATYTGLFTDIRILFAKTADAKMRGYSQDRFSFNLKGGRCESCSGDGTIKIEMHFLPDVSVTCDVCKGKRYNGETLAVKYKGKSIADVLDMTVDEAYDFFESIPAIKRRLLTLKEVGLGYIKLGQSSTTLSGGEAQRVKLACELSKRSTGKTIYILDEPTTGLHSYDVKKLLDIIYKLRDGKNSVIVIEHNLDVIKCADYLIDLGPEGGDKGGNIIATGTPEEVAEIDNSYTGQYLKKIFEKEKK